MKKRLVGMMMAAAMTVSLLAGCSSGGRDTDQGDSDDIVTLKWYMSINPVYPDTEKVIEALNEYTKEKIGVEIDYTVIANPDYKEKMPTMINSGDYFDICFTADWTTNYLQFAAKDAFLDLSELLPEYAADTYDLSRRSCGKRHPLMERFMGFPLIKKWDGSQVFLSTVTWQQNMALI